MFPWLPFLSLHNGDQNNQPRRRRRPGSRKHSSLTSIWLNVDCGESVETVRVEYLPVPFQPHRYTATASSSTDLGFGSTSATIVSENRADSVPLGDLVPQNVQQHHRKGQQLPETSGRSLKPTPENNSRPGSAASQQTPAQPAITAPPPQPRTNRRGRMFETSAAMLEIFGGAPQAQEIQQPSSQQAQEIQQPSSQQAQEIQQPSSQQERDSTALDATSASPAVYESATKQPIASQQNDIRREESATEQTQQAVVVSTSQNVNIERDQSAQAQSASVTFNQIPPTPPTVSASERPQFGRTNALAREGVSRNEWEPAAPQTTTVASSFQTIPNHDVEYDRARHRGNWEGTEASFNNVNQYTQRGISPMRQDEITSSCPADGELRRRHQSGLVNEPVEEIAVVRDSVAPECPLQSVESSPLLAQNGHTNIEKPQRKKREGVADLFNQETDSRWERTTQCVFKPADAAGEPSTSGGVCAAEGPAPFEKPQQPNGSQFGEHLHPAHSATPNSSNLTQDLRENGNHLLDNGTVDPQAEKKKSRFILSLSEDGSGMVAASGSGASGGDSTTPILIRNAQIVNDDAIFAADVLVADGQIKQILPGLDAPENAEVIDVNGRWLLPAGIDLHCEFDNVEDLLNATKDALSGGTTTLVSVVRTTNDRESLVTAFDRIKAQIDSKAECHVALSVLVQKWSSDTKSQAEELCKRRGVNSFVLDVQTDAELFEAMGEMKKLGALSRILPENKDIVSLLEKQFSSLQPSEAYFRARPAQLEAERINRICVLAQLNNVPFSVLSIGSSEACRAIQTGRQQGALAYAEVAISALANNFLSSSSLQSRVPIRPGKQDAHDALELLANSPLSVCVSDHSSIQRGKLSIGTLAVGERLQVLWEKAVASGQIDLMRFVAVTSTNAAKLFNVYPKKGRIAVGADADLVVWNAQSSHRISSRNQNEKSNFDGFTVSGSPDLTICGGRIAFRNGRLSGEKPSGPRFMALQSNAPHVFSVVQLREGKNITLPNPVERKESTASNGNSDARSGSKDRGAAAPQESLQEKQRPITKVIHPPGGRSRPLW